MAADFNWFINRQGARGMQGIQGEQGFSPVITVEEDSLRAYILRIQTQNDTFLTTNLRGTVEDLGGTYVRYNRETGQMYAGSADSATTEVEGMVRLASTQDIAELGRGMAVSPFDVSEMIGSHGTVTDLQDKVETNTQNIARNTQDISTNKTDISSLKNDVTAIKGNYVTTNTEQTINAIKRFSRSIYTNDIRGIQYLYSVSGATIFAGDDNKVILGDTSHETAIRGNIINANYQNRFNIGDNVVNSGGLYYLNQGSIVQGDNIIIENTNKGIKISSTATGGGGLDPDAIKGSDTINVVKGANSVTLSVNSTGVDYELIKNLPTINGEVVIGHMTSKELHIPSQDDINNLTQLIQQLQARVEALEAGIDGGNA